MSVAFVMSGGASLGAIQVGMLDTLLAAGVQPDFVVGASVGAFTGETGWISYCFLLGGMTASADTMAAGNTPVPRPGSRRSRCGRGNGRDSPTPAVSACLPGRYVR